MSCFLLGNFPVCKISQPAKFCRLRNFLGCENSQVLFISLALSSAANPLFPVPAINFTFFLIQPFIRHLRPLIGHALLFPPPPPPPPPPSFPFFPFHFTSHFQFLQRPPPPPFFSFSGSSMVKTRGGSAFQPRVCRSSPPPAGSSSPAPPAVAVAAPPADPPAASVAASVSAAAPAPRRYHTGVGPTPPSTPHPRPSRRAPSSKKARTSSLGESSSSRPQKPQSPPHQGHARAPPLDLYPASIIRWPLFHYNPILGNSDCSERDLHDEFYYDFSSFSTDPELRDWMLLVQRYSLELFMTPHRFFYPRVFIEFYHTMTSRCEPHSTTLHFSINGRPGIP